MTDSILYSLTGIQKVNIGNGNNTKYLVKVIVNCVCIKYSNIAF